MTKSYGAVFRGYRMDANKGYAPRVCWAIYCITQPKALPSLPTSFSIFCNHSLKCWQRKRKVVNPISFKISTPSGFLYRPTTSIMRLLGAAVPFTSSGLF